MECSSGERLRFDGEDPPSGDAFEVVFAAVVSVWPEPTLRWRTGLLTSTSFAAARLLIRAPMWTASQFEYPHGVVAKIDGEDREGTQRALVRGRVGGERRREPSRRAVCPGGSVALSGIAVWLAAVFAALASGGRLLCFGAALGGCTAFGTGA